jgi:hypothetical protein
MPALLFCQPVGLGTASDADLRRQTHGLGQPRKTTYAAARFTVWPAE